MANETIHKYILKPETSQIVKVTGLKKVLSVAEQRGEIVAYVLCNPLRDDLTTLEFVVVGTGHDATDCLRNTFLGTVNLLNGDLMFHVFYSELE